MLTGKSTERDGGPRRRWEDNIRIDFKEIDINTKKFDCFDSGKGLLETYCECGIETSGSLSY